MERVNAINREHRFARAEFGPVGIIAFAPAHCLATVSWTIRDVDGAILWHFVCSYNLAQRAGQWQILVCTNHAPDA